MNSESSTKKVKFQNHQKLAREPGYKVVKAAQEFTIPAHTIALQQEVQSLSDPNELIKTYKDKVLPMYKEAYEQQVKAEMKFELARFVYEDLLMPRYELQCNYAYRLDQIACEWQEIGKHVEKEHERIKLENASAKKRYGITINENMCILRDQVKQETLNNEEIAKENDDLRKQLQEIKTGLEQGFNELPELAAPPTLSSAKEGVDLSGLDAFAELFNVCKQVQNLQQSLDSLTLQADDLLQEPAPTDTSNRLKQAKEEEKKLRELLKKCQDQEREKKNMQHFSKLQFKNIDQQLKSMNVSINDLKAKKSQYNKQCQAAQKKLEECMADKKASEKAIEKLQEQCREAQAIIKERMK